MEQERNEFSSIIQNAEENKREVKDEIERASISLRKNVIQPCEAVISKELEHSIKNDFFLQTDFSAYNAFISWQELLSRYGKALDGIDDIKADELLGEKTTIIENGEDLITSIDNAVGQRLTEFLANNIDLLVEGLTKKHEIELKLKEVEMRREGIMLLKQNNESKTQDLQLQVDNLKFKFWKKRERERYKAEAAAYRQAESHTTELLNELGQQIDELKRQLKDARYNHGGIDIQGRRIKVNYMSKTNSIQTDDKVGSTNEDINESTDEISTNTQEEDLEI